MRHSKETEMTEQEALKAITRLIHKVSGKNVEVSTDHDLRDGNLFDSLDMLVFFMELERETGLAVPETEKLVEEGWYKVKKLCEELANKY